MERKFRLPRVWSNLELKKLSGFFSGDVVNVSAWKDEDKEGRFYRDYFSNAQSYSITNYGGYRGASDVHSDVHLDLEEDLPNELIGKFDVVFNHTTLEHVFDIKKAFFNLCSMSRDIVIVVVPFAQEQHEHENIKDFWRFTPTALRYLFRDNGFHTVYEAANHDVNAGIYIMMIGSRYPDKWSGTLPPYIMLERVGWGIGMSLKDVAKRLLLKMGLRQK